VKVFAILTPTGDGAVDVHDAEASWELYTDDVLRALYDTPDGGLVAVLEAPDGAAATDALRTLPAVASGALDARVIPVKPFDRLSAGFGAGARPVDPPGPTGPVLAVDRVLPGARPSDIGPLVGPEMEHAWAAMKGGAFRENYLQADHPGAVLVLEAAGADHAHELLADLPLVRAGILEFLVWPLTLSALWDRLAER
jgi:hypothetical protein